jgi:hypothetical protein
MKMVSAGRKLNTIEERRQERSCLFRRGYYRNKAHNPEQSILGSIPGEDRFFSSETKYDRRTMRRPKLLVSAGGQKEQRKQP